MESEYLFTLQQDFFNNPKLDYIKIELSTYWRNKRNEQGNSN